MWNGDPSKPPSMQELPVFIAEGPCRMDGDFARRELALMKRVPLGIPYLDEAFSGLLPKQTLLIAAASGGGKTQLAATIAENAAMSGIQTDFIALEAEDFEIERRIQFRLMSQAYFAAETPGLHIPEMSYRNWTTGGMGEKAIELEDFVRSKVQSVLNNLRVIYRKRWFDERTLAAVVTSMHSRGSQLIVLDHVHFLDSHDESDIRAQKQIMQALRVLSQDLDIPIICCAQLRKRESRLGRVQMPSLDDIYGSSDIVKIATKVVVVATDWQAQERQFHRSTLFQIVKDRVGGSQTHVAQCLFDFRKAAYDKVYRIGRIGENGFEVSPHVYVPTWAKSAVTNV